MSTNNNTTKILEAACRLGRNILENGGEIYRVEESINYFLEAYGIYDAQIFALPATIIVTIIEDGEPKTHLGRVKGSIQNLDKLAKFNDLCRRACANVYPIEQVLEEIESIRNEKDFKFSTYLLAYAGTSAFFCLFWKGDVRDAIVAFICGIATKLCLEYMSKVKTNIFFSNAVASAAIAYIAIAFVNLGFAQHYDKIIIGAIMTLVPGIALTNVMRDIIAGDIITGTTKLSEVLLVAVAIAVGIALAMSSVLILGGSL